MKHDFCVVPRSARPDCRRTTFWKLTKIALILVCCAAPSIIFSQTGSVLTIQDKYQGLTPERTKLKIMLDSYFYCKLVEMESRGDLTKASRSVAEYNDQFFQVDAKNRVRVEIGVSELRPEYATELNRVGFEVLYEVAGFHRYDGWLPIDAVYQLTNMEFISFVRAIERPVTNVTSEGDAFHRADLARTTFSVNGSGRKVGIISDGVDHLSNSQGAGELPTVQVINNRNGGDEGTAMLEIVHDLAPGSTLAFADNATSESDFANNIQLLWQAGCQIISDDIIYFHEPAFEDGVIAQKINQIVSAGGVYSSSAGNYRTDHYIGDYVNGGNNWNSFQKTSGTSLYLQVRVPADGTCKAVLQWNEKYGSSNGDYDLYLMDSTGGTTLTSSLNTQNGNDDPFEFLSWKNTTSSTATTRVMVNNYNGAAPTRKLHLWILGDGVLESVARKNESSTFGHSTALGCISAAAVDGSSSQRSYSSEGPALIYTFDSNGNPVSSTQRTKPDVSGRDGVQTYVGQQGNFINPFYGTSAATPHIAAIAALIWSANTSQTAAEIRSRIENTAVGLPTLGGPKNNQFGYGRADAYNALSATPTSGNWVSQTSGVTSSLLTVKAVDLNTAWIGGAGAVVLRTTNGGDNWTSVGRAPISGDVYAIEALDASTAFVATTPSGQPTFIYRTTNGGAVWTQVFSLTGGFSDGIRMVDAATGYAVGDPVGGKWMLLKTIDGGASWGRMATEPTPGSSSEAGWNNALQVLQNGGNTLIWFGTNNSRVYRSTNGGTTWSWATTPFTNSYDLHFVSSLEGVAAGDAAARTTDGGTTWALKSVPGTGNITGVSGSGTVDYWTSRGSIVYRSTDRGDTWAASHTGTGTYFHLDFYTSGSNTRGWAVSDAGGISRYDGLITVGVQEMTPMPYSFGLEQNYPNPFNPISEIGFRIAEGGHVTLKVYDCIGREMATLVNERRAPGTYTVKFDASELASGVYFYRLVSGRYVETRKMLLLR